MVAPVQQTGDTLPEKLYGAVEEVTGERQPEQSVPDKSKSFFEEVSEFTGRLWGQLRQACRWTGEKVQEEGVGVKDTVAKGWPGQNSGPPQGGDGTNGASTSEPPRSDL